MTTTTKTPSATRRLVRNMLGTYRRLDTGESGGRNANATYSTLELNWARLRAALEAGGFEELDADPKLAARYATLERRHLVGRSS